MKKLCLLLLCGLFVMAGYSSPFVQGDGDCCKDSKDSMRLVMNIKRKILPEHVSAFKASFEKCKVATLQEPGCLEYSMYQSYTDSTEFVIVEIWANKGAHLNHMTLPHFKTHMTEIRGVSDPSFKGGTTEVYVCPMVNK